MTTAYHVDVQQATPVEMLDVSSTEVVSWIFFLVLISLCVTVFALFRTSASRARDREMETAMRRIRRRTGETGPFVHLRIGSRHSHHHHRSHH